MLTLFPGVCFLLNQDHASFAPFFASYANREAECVFQTEKRWAGAEDVVPAGEQEGADGAARRTDEATEGDEHAEGCCSSDICPSRRRLCLSLWFSPPLFHP